METKKSSVYSCFSWACHSLWTSLAFNLLSHPWPFPFLYLFSPTLRCREESAFIYWSVGFLPLWYFPFGWSCWVLDLESKQRYVGNAVSWVPNLFQSIGTFGMLTEGSGIWPWIGCHRRWTKRKMSKTKAMLNSDHRSSVFQADLFNGMTFKMNMLFKNIFSNTT